MKRSKETKINYDFKLLYFFGLVLVVIGHVSFGIDSCANVVSPFTSWIYTFHLGIFAFASGYFFKDESADKPHLYILKKAKRLLLPLFIYNLIYGLFTLALRQGDFTMGKAFNLYNLFVEPFISGHQFDFNLGGWFIIPFFMVEVFVCLLRFCFRKIRNNWTEIGLFIFSVLLGILGIELAMRGYNTGGFLTLTKFLYWIPFFSLGIFYNRFLEKYDKKCPTIVYFAAIALIEVVMICYFKGVPDLHQAFMQGFESIGSVATLVFAFTGLALWLRIAKLLGPIFGKSKLVNLVADNAYSITINQLLGFFILNSIYFGFSKFIPAFSNFVYAGEFSYTSYVYYVYLINDQWISGIIYVIFGLGVPVAIGEGIKFVKRKSLSLIDNLKESKKLKA